jgi:alanine racemase
MRVGIPTEITADEDRVAHPTRALIHLDRLTHNLHLLHELAGERPMWPVIKANAYGHGATIVARHLMALDYDTLCVAHAFEAVELREAGVNATFLLLSPALPEESELIVEQGLEPVVCTGELVDSLSQAAQRIGRPATVHVKVDTGMGRVGIPPQDVVPFLEHCQKLSGLRVRGIMSHFPRADEADKSFSREQIATFRRVQEQTAGFGIDVYHLANSAGILDLPDSGFDAVRPGISIYGLAPSPTIASPHVRELRPVLEWKTRITLLKDVPAGVGLSYGHTFNTKRPSLIATLPVGYGDGLHRGLSNRMDVLVGGERCPQVGTITMDQILVDVTALRGRARVGDEVVLIGRQADAELTADTLAATLGTINYEIVTSLAPRVPRIPTNVNGPADA